MVTCIGGGPDLTVVTWMGGGADLATDTGAGTGGNVSCNGLPLTRIEGTTGDGLVMVFSPSAEEVLAVAPAARARSYWCSISCMIFEGVLIVACWDKTTPSLPLSPSTWSFCELDFPDLCCDDGTDDELEDD